MRNVTLAMIITTFSAPDARSAELFNPASLVSRSTNEGHIESVISVFPPGGIEFNISLPLIIRWFAYGPSGRSAYATAFKETGSRSFTDQRGMFRIELDPVRVSAIPGLDAFYSLGPFAVSQREDFVVFGGSKGNYPAGRCGVYKIGLPAGKLRAVIETSDCRGGSPWRVLSVSPEGTEALILSDRRLALLELSKGLISKLDGQLSSGSFSPDGKWIAALQLENPNPAKTILIDRTDLTNRRELGAASDNETAWSPDSKLLLQTVYRPACPSQNPLALQTLEVQTGNRTLLKDSVCNSGSSGQIGWIRADIKR